MGSVVPDDRKSAEKSDLSWLGTPSDAPAIGLSTGWRAQMMRGYLVTKKKLNSSVQASERLCKALILSSAFSGNACALTMVSSSRADAVTLS